MVGLSLGLLLYPEMKTMDAATAIMFVPLLAGSSWALTLSSSPWRPVFAREPRNREMRSDTCTA